MERCTQNLSPIEAAQSLTHMIAVMKAEIIKDDSVSTRGGGGGGGEGTDSFHTAGSKIRSINGNYDSPRY